MPKDIKNPNIEESRNTAIQMNYYSEMETLMSESALSYNEIIQDFPVFASRQQITYFLERYELYKKVQRIPWFNIRIGSSWRIRFNDFGSPVLHFRANSLC